jgi:DNA-binding response OmpR family regulator
MSEALHTSTTKARILIVEDEPQMCELLGEIVSDEGFDAHCVRSDRAAYAALRSELRENCACMIVDVNLGSGTTGYDVARFARQLRPQLPVIYVSGQTTEVSYQANGVPGSLFVPKPFTPDELMEQVHKLVGDNDDHQRR